MNRNLHEPAMKKVARVTTDAIIGTFENLAKAAVEFDAADAQSVFGWVDEDERVGAPFVPQLIMRVVKPGTK